MGAGNIGSGDSSLSFDSWQAFLSMGGHGLYVWLCYGAGMATFVLVALSPIIERRTIVRELVQRQRRKQAQQAELGQAAMRAPAAEQGEPR